MVLLQRIEVPLASIHPSSPLVGKIASATLTFLPPWPHIALLSLPSLLVLGFLLSKYCTHTCLQVYYDSLQHGAWTSWHSRLFGGSFDELGVASSILHDTTYYCGVMDFSFLGRRCLNSWFICASVSRQFLFEMSFRQSLISSFTWTWFAYSGLSVNLSSWKYCAKILLAVDWFTLIVVAMSNNPR